MLGWCGLILVLVCTNLGKSWVSRVVQNDRNRLGTPNVWLNAWKNSIIFFTYSMGMIEHIGNMFHLYKDICLFGTQIGIKIRYFEFWKLWFDDASVIAIGLWSRLCDRGSGARNCISIEAQ